MKYHLTIVSKGGSGSGHFGHSGRPGKVGGSSGSGGSSKRQSKRGATKALDKTVDRIASDEQFMNVMVALMADGEYGGFASFTAALQETLNEKDWVDEDDLDEIVSKRYKNLEAGMDQRYSKARRDKGWEAPAFVGFGMSKSKADTFARKKILERWPDAKDNWSAYNHIYVDAMERLTAKKAKLSAARMSWEKKYYGKVVGGYQNGQDYAYKLLHETVYPGTPYEPEYLDLANMNIE